MQGQEIVTLKLPNGTDVAAPAGLWMLALSTVLPPKLRIEWIEAVVKIKDEHIAKNSIWNPRAGAPGLNLEDTFPNLSSTPAPTLENLQGLVTHTDFWVDGKGKKHYTMHCEPGTYHNLMFGADRKLTEEK